MGATRGEHLFDGTKLTVKYFFDALDVIYYNDLLVNKIDKKGEIKNHPEYFKKAHELGKSLVLKGGS